jgi:hypothetical protein
MSVTDPIGAPAYDNTQKKDNCYQDVIPSEAQWVARSENTGEFNLKTTITTDTSTNTKKVVYMGYGETSDGSWFSTREGLGINGQTSIYFERESGNQGYLLNQYLGVPYYLRVNLANGQSHTGETWADKDNYTAVYLYKKVIPDRKYEYTITNKPSAQQGDSVSNVTVTKKWPSGMKEADKPAVTVYLYDENGERKDTVTLDTSNNWKYTWKNLKKGSYTVSEEEVEGYTSKITCDRSEKSIFVGTDTISNDDTYVVGTLSNSSYNYYTVWRNQGEGKKLTYDTLTMNKGSITIGPNTYTNYFTNVPVSDQWTMNYVKMDSSGTYKGYKIQTASDGSYLTRNSSDGYIYVNNGVSGDNVYRSGSYWGFPYQSYFLRYTYKNGNYYYDVDSNCIEGTVLNLYRKISETTYNYTITNTPETSTNKKVSSSEEYTKRIDALRDGTNNTDTTVDDNKNTDLTDLYRLYLNVGPMKLNQGVDLVLVVDKSSSMTQQTQYGVDTMRRDKALSMIINGTTDKNGDISDGLISEFLSMNENNRVSVVSFAGNYTGLTDSSKYYHSVDGKIEQNWITSAKYVSVQLDSDVDTGTNYTAGLYYANYLFGLSRPTKYANNKRIMIFLSDGVPTYYGYDMKSENTYDEKNEVTGGTQNMRYGTGASATYNSLLCIEPSMKAFDQFSKNNEDKDITTYTVGFSPDINASSGDVSASPSVLRYMAETGGGEYLGASDGDALRSVLEEYILAGGKYTNVSITDQLSQYVDLYTKPEYKVTMTLDGKETVLWGNNEKGGNGVTAAGKYIIQDVTYDKATHTVKLQFNPGYEFLTNATYELSFNVKTSDYAYNQTMQNRQNGKDPYTLQDGTAGVGDTGTDYGSNDTSSNHGGFPSNRNATCHFVRDGEEGEIVYDHPVVQTGTCNLTIRKVSRGTGKLLDNAEFILYRKASTGSTNTVTGGGNTGLPEGTYEIVNSSITTGTITNGDTGSVYGAVTLSNLTAGNYYLVEKNPPNGYNKPENAFQFRLMRSSVTVSSPEQGSQYLLSGSPESTILTVENENCYTLPQTGGNGRSWIYWTGCMLLLGAIGCVRVLYVYSKRHLGAHRAGR